MADPRSRRGAPVRGAHAVSATNRNCPDHTDSPARTEALLRVGAVVVNLEHMVHGRLPFTVESLGYQCEMLDDASRWLLVDELERAA